MTKEDPLIRFTERLRDEWLPTYCHDPKRDYSVAGYRDRPNQITASDASDFMWSLDNRIVEDHGGGRYRVPRSGADVIIFWEGRKAKSPGPITLSREPVITIASIARLYRDHRWPTNCLGMEPGRWQFDFGAFLSAASSKEHIAGEVKKDVKELDRLLKHLHDMCRDGGSRISVSTAGRADACKKWEGLCRSRAPLFWAVGPGGISHVLEVSYDSEGPASFKEVSFERLAYNGAA